ncbi:cellulose binding domain-containing protein [Catellatospora paridis]|uniref:cellulose binding domain-containing protein n=1 Tax=Catellatospora paridis TaxID=1617086 RepID=UPI0012D3E234|nr:SRPBCC domain-containing protein [Catellatospora paridis]
MTVLRLDVELPFPVESVWQALTDRRLLGEWFLQTDLMPVPGGVYRAYPGGDLPGFTAPFDMDVIEVVGPTRLALRWRGEQLHADVVWELSTVAGGSRLRVSQTGFLGIAGQVCRAELQRAYATMFEQRLPALLARQEEAAALPARRRRSKDIYDAADMPRRPPAVATVSAAAGTARPPAGASMAALAPGARPAVGLDPRMPPAAIPDPPTPSAASPDPRDPGLDAGAPFATGSHPDLSAGAEDEGPLSGGLLARVFHMPVDRRLRLLSAAGAMVLTVLAVTAVATLVLRSPGPAAEPVDSARGPWSGVQAGESTTPSAEARSASPAASPSASAAAPSAAAAAPAGPGPTEAAAPALAVSYRTLETWSGGYIGEITIRPVAVVDGWSAAVTLPAGATVTSAWDRIDFRQDGSRVTFTPQDVHRRLPAGKDFVLAFQVGDPSGATRPEGCVVEGVSCAKR